jgi:hypothetical protein
MRASEVVAIGLREAWPAIMLFLWGISLKASVRLENFQSKLQGEAFSLRTLSQDGFGLVIVIGTLQAVKELGLWKVIKEK